MRYKSLSRIAAARSYEIQQIDMKAAFVDVDKEVCPEQLDSHNKVPNEVCRLKNIIYGLKQAPNLG